MAQALAEVLGAPPTFAEQLGLEPSDTAITFPTAMKIAARLDSPVALPRPVVLAGDEAGKTKFQDLPLTPDIRDESHLRHVIECILDWEGEVDKNALTSIVKAGATFDPMTLPSPIRPKQATLFDFKLDLCIVPTDDGKHNIFKHYIFDKPIPITMFKDMAEGAISAINWGPAKKYGAPAFLIMWSQLGGYQICNYTFKKEKAVKETDDIDKGYDLCREGAKLPRRNNQQNRWIMKMMNDPNCVLSKWTKGDIKEGIATVREESITAVVHNEFPICHLDQPEWWQKAKETHIIPYLLSNSIIMLGKAGTAKSPDCYINGFAVSRYHGDLLKKVDWNGEMREASNFDFFRLDSGAVERPDFFDDGDLNKQDPSKTKMFFDPSRKSAKTKERWGGAEFVQNQLRMAADNKLNFDAYPTDIEYAFNNFAIP